MKYIDSSRIQDEKIKKIRKEYFKSENEYRKRKKRKIIILIIAISIVILIIKLTVGNLYIDSPISYAENRRYDVWVDDDLMGVEVTDTYQRTLIPYFLYYRAYWNEWYTVDSHYVINYYADFEENQFILNVKSYSCYSHLSTNQVGCRDGNSYQEKIENNDTVYALKITDSTHYPYKVVYDGDFIHDISPYIAENSVYYIDITASYKHVKSVISFNIVTKKELEL